MHRRVKNNDLAQLCRNRAQLMLKTNYSTEWRQHIRMSASAFERKKVEAFREAIASR